VDIWSKKMAAILVFKDAALEQVSNVLSNMLSHSEIGKYLSQCGISDPLSGTSKRVRLFEALRQKQIQDHCANNVCAFIKRVMAPVLYVQREDIFLEKRTELNHILGFEGMSLTEQGELVLVKQVRTIPEAQAAADHLRMKLEKRGVYSDVLTFCRAELLQENYFHAVLEAAKSVSQKIRDKSGLTSDGAELVDEAFGIGKKQYPLLAFNTLKNESEQSEHKGFMNLMKGLVGAFRNPTAHAPKIFWNISEQDAMDMMILASLLHRKLDASVKTTP
jgi:uncharacterized protein (TIGR02391 family)